MKIRDVLELMYAYHYFATEITAVSMLRPSCLKGSIRNGDKVAVESTRYKKKIVSAIPRGK